VAIQLQGGLAGLIGKLVGKPESAEAGKGDAQAAVGGLVQQVAQNLAGATQAQRGIPLGDGKVLAGLGYSGKDKQTSDKNVTERENIQRFVREPDLGKLGAHAKAEDRGADKAANEKPGAERDAARAEEGRAAEPRNEARAEEPRAQHQEPAPREEARARETPQALREEQRSPEDGGHGQGHGRGDDGDEAQEQDGQHARDVLGDVAHCKHVGGDGARCLLRPLDGSNYCRDHALA
jgi:hypothetical protein